MDPPFVPPYDTAPAELRVAVEEFWEGDERTNAIRIAYLESAWDAFALNDTTSSTQPCGSLLRRINGKWVTAEKSIGYFQINSCNFEGWEWQRFYNARHNAGTAHLLWVSRGWAPWFFSATRLGLL